MDRRGTRICPVRIKDNDKIFCVVHGGVSGGMYGGVWCSCWCMVWWCACQLSTHPSRRILQVPPTLYDQTVVFNTGTYSVPCPFSFTRMGCIGGLVLGSSVPLHYYIDKPCAGAQKSHHTCKSLNIIRSLTAKNKEYLCLKWDGAPSVDIHTRLYCVSTPLGNCLSNTGKICCTNLRGYQGKM